MKYVGPLLLALFLCLSLQAQDQEEGFFVLHQCATSASLMIAKQKALLNTKGELATQINGKITSVSQSYLTEDLGNDVLKEEFINESKIAAQVILKNIAIAEEIPVKEKDGRYTVHITLKVRETDVLDAIRKHVMANERLQKVFKKEKFDELWNE